MQKLNKAYLVSSPIQSFQRLQGLIDDPNTSQALKIGYLNEKIEWVKRLPVQGKSY